MQPVQQFTDPGPPAGLRDHLHRSLDPNRVRPVIAGLLTGAHEPLTSDVIALEVMSHFGVAVDDALAVRVMAKRVALCLLAESSTGIVRLTPAEWVARQ